MISFQILYKELNKLPEKKEYIYCLPTYIICKSLKLGKESNIDNCKLCPLHDSLVQNPSCFYLNNNRGEHSFYKKDYLKFIIKRFPSVLLEER